MNRRRFLKAAIGSAVVSAVAPKSLLSPSSYVAGVDVGMGEDQAVASIYRRAHDDCYFFVGTILIESPRTMYRLENITLPEDLDPVKL